MQNEDERDVAVKWGSDHFDLGINVVREKVRIWAVVDITFVFAFVRCERTLIYRVSKCSRVQKQTSISAVAASELP